MREPLEKCYWEARDFAKRQQLVDADFLEKYAELIVRECINIIKPTETDPVLQYKWLNFYDKENRLKEHFGVEE